SRELFGLGRRPRAEVGDAQTARQERGILERRDETVREAGDEKRLPEPIAGASEVMAHRPRIQAWIDADEEDVEAGRDHVAQAAADGPSEVLGRGPVERGQSRVHRLCAREISSPSPPRRNRCANASGTPGSGTATET